LEHITAPLLLLLLLLLHTILPSLLLLGCCRPTLLLPYPLLLLLLLLLLPSRTPLPPKHLQAPAQVPQQACACSTQSTPHHLASADRHVEEQSAHVMGLAGTSTGATAGVCVQHPAHTTSLGLCRQAH
jgi:hypothetical protein